MTKQELEYVVTFWNAPMEAFFNEKVISPVVGSSVKTLQANRWKGEGIPFRKINWRVLYRKSDVIEYLESHKLTLNTMWEK